MTHLPFLAAPIAAAGPAQELAWLLIAIPLASAGLLLLAGKVSDAWGHWVAVLASTASGVLGFWLLFDLLALPSAERVRNLDLGTWFDAGTFQLNAGLRLDPLSVTFVLLVTFVGTLIHIYAVAYMAEDTDRRRFFAYLNLFIAAMLTLVLANSYLLLFFGWEGVGLASYLLIGFWNQDRANAVAAKKAFIMNRVGDLGLLIAMFVMFDVFGAIDFETVFSGAADADPGRMNVIGLMLLVAACGKSAQFPLQAWLGDAMAGPTPVSALIHAATMVTAGVYLVVRSAPIYELAPTALTWVAVIGAITLLFGAIVGLAKDDIKKTLAASTMSQIGYMMLAAGLGPVGYAFAIFHLITHGFFKAGMFLGAGSVMHGMNEQVDMRRYGALAKYMKITWITFALGWLAILGVPPFSGFWSKDKIIEAAFVGEGMRPWILGSVALFGAFLTAFYMSRLFFMTFHGRERWEHGQDPQESPALMTVPMIILAIGSAGLGLVLAQGNIFVDWLSPVTGDVGHHDPVLPIPVIMGATLLVVLVGAFLAWRQYAQAPVPVTAPLASMATVAARNDLFQDVVNETLVMWPGKFLTRGLVFFERGVDGITNGLGKGIAGTGELIRKAQSGYVRSYASYTLLGVLLAVAIALVAR